MIRVYMFLFIVGTFSAMGYGAYSYVMNLQQQVNTLRENNVLLEQAVATNQETIDRMADEAAQSAELQAQLQDRLQAAQKRVNGLRTRLSQIDITREALADPVDMEARINRGVKRLIDDILKETGGEVVTDSNDDTTTE